MSGENINKTLLTFSLQKKYLHILVIGKHNAHLEPIFKENIENITVEKI